MKRIIRRTSTFAFILLLNGSISVIAETLVLNPDGPQTAEIERSQNSRGDAILEFSFRSAEVDSVVAAGRTWTSLKVPGTSLTSRSGFPELPQISSWISVHSANLDWNILELDSVTVTLGAIVPAPEIIQRAANSTTLPRTPSLQFYSGNESFPDSPVELTYSGNLGNRRIALITFHPVRTNPLTGVTTFYTRIRVHFQASGGALDESDPAVASHVSLMRSMSIPDLSPPAIRADSRMIIVTEPEFDDALAPWIAWKNRCGISTENLHYSSIAQNAAQLKELISDLYESAETPPEFLLLVGDVTEIPAFFGINLSLTDHPYSMIVGDDFLPDISVGRLPCGSPAECSQWIDRILNYERDGQIHWNMSATVFSSSAASDPQHGIAISNLFLTHGVNVTSLQQPQSSTLPLLVNGLNAGPEWVFYIGHGNSQSWLSVNPPFQNTQLPNVLQTSSSIVVSVACATADLDYPGASLGEAWASGLLENGALAYFGATESTAFFYSDTLGIAALRGVFEENLERLGTATDYGRLLCAQYFPQGPGGITEETIQQFVLLGDPSMRVYSSSPQELDVEVLLSVPIGTTTIPVTVRMNGSVLPDADVCLTYSNGNTVCATTTENGLALLTLEASNPTTLYLTITARNAIPWLSEVHVVPVDGPFVSVSSWEILDDSGDHDGELDRGESITLRIQLTNDGTAWSTAGMLTMNCENPAIVIERGSAELNALVPGESLWISDTLSLSANLQATDATSALLECSIVSEGYSAVSYISLPLHAPVIEVTESTMREDSGDGDGNPEAGERLALEFTIQNSGSDRAEPLFVQLNGSFDYLHIQETGMTLPVLASGESAIARFLFETDPTTPRGYSFEYNYLISSPNVPSQAGWGVVRVGLIPVLLYELDEMPDEITGIEAALFSLGIEYERRTSLPTLLDSYKSIWIFCGVSPNQRALSQQDANRIAQFLDNGGACYWEGADVWAFNLQTVLNPYFHIIGLSDGTSNAGPIEGEYGSLYSEYAFEYNGENSFIDQLGPGAGANVLLRNDRPNADYAVCISFAGENYRTIGSSIEIGSLADGEYPSSRVRLIREFLEWFGIETRADVFAPVIQHIPLAGFYQQNVPIEISADIQDASGVATAELHYRLDTGNWNTVVMNLSNGMYRATIPGVAFGTHIDYKFRAVDSSPMSNADLTDLFSFDVERPQVRPIELAFIHESSSTLRPRVDSPAETSWSLTRSSEGFNVLELQGSAEGPISYTTRTMDGSALSTPEIGFWNRLRSSNTDVSIARVLGSADGGISFPHVVWERAGDNVLESGYVQSGPQHWMAGSTEIVFKFEYRGDAYWQLGPLTISPSSSPKSIPVENLVIQPEGRFIRLSWKENPNAVTYAVLSSGQSDSHEFSLLAETAQTTYADLSAEFSDMKFYRVQALLNRGDTRALQLIKVKNIEADTRDRTWNQHRRRMSK